MRFILTVATISWSIGSWVASADATVLFEDTFSKPDRNLVGSTPDIGTTWGGPIFSPDPPSVQIVSNTVHLANNGEDPYSTIPSPASKIDGNALYYSMDINLSATGSGDDFFDLNFRSQNTGSLYARAATGGYQIGLQANAFSPGAVYGSPVLAFNTWAHVVVAWHYVAGVDNDPFTVYINPTSLSEGANPVYLTTSAWGSGSQDFSGPGLSATGLNLNQGSAFSTRGNGPTMALDNLIIGTSFGDVAGVPEPSSLALLGLGTLSLFEIARRRRKA